MTGRIGLIGYPISHSQSPALFREFFSSRPDILERYSYELVETPDFGEAIAFFRKYLVACNVTSPFKDMAFGAADDRSYRAMRAEAANLLFRNSVAGTERTVADNTDFSAVWQILSGLPAGNGKVLVVGCGGAAKAAAAAAVECGKDVSMTNRTLSKAEAFAENLLIYDPHHAGSLKDIVPPSGVRLESYGTVIVALPDEKAYAMYPFMDRLPCSGKTVIEASYSNPQLAGIPGITYISGREWLRLQAVETYKVVIGSDAFAD